MEEAMAPSSHADLGLGPAVCPLPRRAWALAGGPTSTGGGVRWDIGGEREGGEGRLALLLFGSRCWFRPDGVLAASLGLDGCRWPPSARGVRRVEVWPAVVPTQYRAMVERKRERERGGVRLRRRSAPGRSSTAGPPRGEASGGPGRQHSFPPDSGETGELSGEEEISGPSGLFQFGPYWVDS